MFDKGISSISTVYFLNLKMVLLVWFSEHLRDCQSSKRRCLKTYDTGLQILHQDQHTVLQGSKHCWSSPKLPKFLFETLKHLLTFKHDWESTIFQKNLFIATEYFHHFFLRRKKHTHTHTKNTIKRQTTQNFPSQQLLGAPFWLTKCLFFHRQAHARALALELCAVAPVAFGFMSKARCGLMSGVSPKRCVGVATFVQFRPFFLGGVLWLCFLLMGSDR